MDQIESVLVSEVIRREVLEGDKAVDAKRRVAKAANKSLRKMTAKDTSAGEQAAASA